MPEREKDCNTKEFKEYRKDADEIFNKLLKQLNEEQKTDLYGLEESWAEMRFETEDYMFEKGFKLGAKFIAEIFFEKKSVLNKLMNLLEDKNQ